MTRLESLLKLVADRPDGDKVNIQALVRCFTPTQGQIIAAIQRLIDDGYLDPVNLRRVEVAEPIGAPEESTAEDQDSPPCEEPPGATAAEDEGGGAAARNDEASPPIDLDRLLECFSEEFETLRIIAARFGIRRPQNIVRAARDLLARGLIEQSPPKSGQPFCLWRRAKARKFNISMAERNRRWEEKHKNNRGASGTARKASSAEESTPAKAEITAERIEDRAPLEEPVSSARDAGSIIPAGAASHPADPPAEDPKAGESGSAMVAPEPRPALEESSRPVDIKVNIGPRLSPVERGKRIRDGRRQAAIEKAQKRIDAGLPANLDQGVQVKIEQERLLREQADADRLSDPIEQAKTIIRIAGYRVFGAAVVGGPKGMFYIDNKLVARDELLARAEQLRRRRA